MFEELEQANASGALRLGKNNGRWCWQTGEASDSSLVLQGCKCLSGRRNAPTDTLEAEWTGMC